LASIPPSRTGIGGRGYLAGNEIFLVSRKKSKHGTREGYFFLTLGAQYQQKAGSKRFSSFPLFILIYFYPVSAGGRARTAQQTTTAAEEEEAMHGQTQTRY
jgi:hypothetical protein